MGTPGVVHRHPRSSRALRAWRHLAGHDLRSVDREVPGAVRGAHRRWGLVGSGLVQEDAGRRTWPSVAREAEAGAAGDRMVHGTHGGLHRTGRARKAVRCAVLCQCGWVARGLAWRHVVVAKSAEGVSVEPADTGGVMGYDGA